MEVDGFAAHRTGTVASVHGDSPKTVPNGLHQGCPYGITKHHHNDATATSWLCSVFVYIINITLYADNANLKYIDQNFTLFADSRQPCQTQGQQGRIYMQASQSHRERRAKRKIKKKKKKKKQITIDRA